MFIPTNPNDRHQTDMEYQEWQRQRDAKKDDFPYISLSKDEMDLLIEVENKPLVQSAPSIHHAAKRLQDLDFIKIVKPANSGPKDHEYCTIRDRGISYLQYISREKEKVRQEHIHNWKIAIFSAFAGALLSRPIWVGLDWIISIFLK